MFLIGSHYSSNPPIQCFSQNLLFYYHYKYQWQYSYFPIDLLLKRFALIYTASPSCNWKERVNCFVAGWFRCHYSSHYVVTVTGLCTGKSNNHLAYFYPSVTGKIEYGCGVSLQPMHTRVDGMGWGDPAYFRLLLTVNNRRGQNSSLLSNGLQPSLCLFLFSHMFLCIFF